MKLCHAYCQFIRGLIKQVAYFTDKEKQTDRKADFKTYSTTRNFENFQSEKRYQE
jgi:hypothetical protein